MFLSVLLTDVLHFDFFKLFLILFLMPAPRKLPLDETALLDGALLRLEYNDFFDLLARFVHLALHHVAKVDQSLGGGVGVLLLLDEDDDSQVLPRSPHHQQDVLAQFFLLLQVEGGGCVRLNI